MADSKADAPFVFEGSVKSLSASNVAAVPADARTAILQVDHVRQAPRALAGFAGKEVTLRLAQGEKLVEGDKAVFFTDALVFADQLAVQSLGHDPLVPMEAKAAIAGVGPVVQRLRRRIDQAQSVISGEVTAVRPHKAVAKAKAASGSGRPGGSISEHAPFWQDAEIAVTNVHKGPSQRKIVVRFPDSTDVRWRNAPRFKKGQKGIWLLNSGAPAPGAAKSAAAAPPASGFYTALDPNDFHSAAEASVLEAMLPSPAAAAKKSAAKKAGTKPARARGKKR